MNGINKVMLLGTVGKDPEIKVISETSRVVTFTMATNEFYTDKSGNKQEKTEWHNIEAWGFLCDLIGSYVVKGSNIFVEGKIKTESYTDKVYPEKTNYKTKIVIDSLNFIPGGKKPEGATSGQQQPPQNQQAPQYAQPVQNQQAPQYAQPVQGVQQGQANVERYMSEGEVKSSQQFIAETSGVDNLPF